MLLPPELMDHIFRFLERDTPALQACSKAHPLYSRLAERHLYTDIVVDLGVSELHKQLSQNPRFLDYPRALEIRPNLNCPPLLVLSIMRMIPRMPNLRSLSVSEVPLLFLDNYNEFISCLQQSSIERLELSYFYNFPVSILDNCKNIKHLTLSDCIATKESISTPPSSQQPLETLMLGNPNQGLYIWAMRRVTRLTSLGLKDLSLNDIWTMIPLLLTACSNSLTRLHLEIDSLRTSTYLYDAVGQVGHWDEIDHELPFTLSALTHLKNLSIFTPINETLTTINCELPEIIRLIQTAPAVQHVVLGFHHHVLRDITSLHRLDWSILDRLQSNFTAARLPVDLHITGESVGGSFLSSERVLDALAGNETLMDLVERGSVILKSELPLADL